MTFHNWFCGLSARVLRSGQEKVDRVVVVIAVAVVAVVAVVVTVGIYSYRLGISIELASLAGLLCTVLMNPAYLRSI